MRMEREKGKRGGQKIGVRLRTGFPRFILSNGMKLKGESGICQGGETLNWGTFPFYTTT